MKIQIFVSYCHEDVKADDQRLKVFTSALEAAGRGTYDILVDHSHKDAAIGGPLPDFIKRIDSADAAILLLTAGYRDRVQKKGSTGVYAEFRRIYDRVLEAEAKKSYGQTFLLLPVLFSGSFADSCPTEVQRFIGRDLTWLYVIPEQHGRLRRTISSQLKRFVDEIAARIAAIAATKTSAYMSEKKDLFQSFLFEDTKSRFDNPELKSYVETAFVKTASFQKVQSREVSFVVGRKGAGKSTITHVLPLVDPKPDLVLKLEFEHLPFEMGYNVLLEHPGEASDLRRAFSPIYSYQLLWDVFLHLYLAWAARDRWRGQSELRRLLDKRLRKGVSRFDYPVDRDVLATRILFVFAFEQLVSFLRRAVRSSGSDAPMSSIVAAFTPGAFREYVFGRKGLAELATILEAYHKTSERVLITADGFDVVRGYFTEESDNPEAAALFERELLLALFQIVLNKGPAKSGGGRLYSISDFCIAIPHDRFLHIRRIDRDRYQYRLRFSSITWSGIELSSLVRKRLALLRGVPDPAGPALEDRLTAVMRKGYPELPEEVAFQFGTATYHIPLFTYVLRHTFWRPRDVLYYYAAILAASKRFQKKRLPMQTETIRQIIAGSARFIIEDEFIDEFRMSFRNLRQVLKTFRQSPQVLGWSDLQIRIEGMRFETSLPVDECASLEWKIELLYDIGVLGVVLDRATSERLSVFRHAFSFNEGDLLTERLGRESYRSLGYALHPVFAEYLHLDTGGNPELILPLTWEYLHRNEVLRGIVPA
ncbi:MAG: hypothetical protein ABSD98_08635 [Candidatus Korobacteraceae bacterium]|jgi:hypothetical protein